MTRQKEKILLVLPPFWMPLIPPLGIACLKSFLASKGFDVTTSDANTDENLREYYDYYFETLKQKVPANRRGNFFSIGQDVLRNHLMAHINTTDETEYVQLVQTLIYHTFYTRVDEDTARKLIEKTDEFFIRLENYFTRLLEDVNPYVLGLSLFNGTLPAALFMLRTVKQKYPHIRTVVGGGAFADQLAPGSPNMDAFLERIGPYIDKVIIGEGELLLLKYLNGELDPDKKVYNLGDINWQLMDIRTAEPADLSGFNLEAYPNLASYTSRSCPFQCSFCSETVQWGKYRKKTGKQIVRELSGYYEKYGRQVYFMSDSLLNPVLDDLAREFIDARISIYWDGCIRADKAVCDREKTMLWRRGGFYRARLGMESASQNVLDLMEKRITTQQMSEALASLASAGIKTSTLWLIGHPGETEEDFQQTLDFIEEYRDFMYDAEGTPFWYHLRGQSNSDDWYKRTSSLLYPESAKDMLIAQTWVLEGMPSREETYKRLNRFTQHLVKLGMPNPYSLQDIYRADERWQKLHENAVPRLVELKDPDIYIDENQSFKSVSMIQNTLQHDGEWGF